MKKETTKLRMVLRRIIKNSRTSDNSREKAREALEATYEIEKQYSSN